MAGIGGFGRSRPAIALLAAGLLAAAPAPTRASDEEAPVQLLRGNVVAAFVFDLDGDGANEVIRLIDEAGTLIIDAWGFDTDRWNQIGPVELHHGRSGPDAGPGAPVTLGAFMPWSGGGRERLLVLLSEIDTTSSFVPRCCLSINELRLANGDLELVPMVAEMAADDARVADLDGDGTGELITVLSDFDDPLGAGTTNIEVHRWDGRAWSVVHRLEREASGYGLLVGETDGVPGDEVLVSSGGPDGLIRLGWEDGAVVEESPELPGSLDRQAWPVGVADALIVLASGDAIDVVRWPRGRPPEVTASSATAGFPLVQVIGDGDDALIMVGGSFGIFGQEVEQLTVLDLNLRELATFEVDPIISEISQLASTGRLSGLEGRGVFPYIGPLPGSDAFVAGGTLVTPSEGGVASRPIGSLMGSQPLGLAGPDDGWAVLGDGRYGSFGGFAVVQGPFPMESDGHVSLVPFELLARPDEEILGAAVELDGAVELERHGVVATLLARRDGFTVRVTAPSGSMVVLVSSGTPPVSVVGDEPLELEITPIRGRNEGEDQPFERSLLVLSPSGHGSFVRWEGTFVAQPPGLEAAATTNALALSATVRGEAGARASVMVDGRLVATDERGRFEIDVEAPIWPRAVVVTARDPLGNETTRRLEVVGFADYRGLPWLPILGATTIVAGVVMFLRVPRRRALELPADGDGRLEEIDGDR